MNTERCYLTLGNIVFTYTRIDFWLGYIGMYLGLAKSHIDFFSEQGIVSKIEKIKLVLLSKSDKYEIPLAVEILNELLDATKKRNSLIHGLILSNDNTLRIHHYKSSKLGAINNSYTITIEELEAFSKYYIELHNKVYELMLEIETKTANS